MKIFPLLILFLGMGGAVAAQTPSEPDGSERSVSGGGDSTRTPWITLPLPAPTATRENEWLLDYPEEEEGATYLFRPGTSGDGRYLPQGQLARSLALIRFRPRGYDNRYLRYAVNGAELADPTDGTPYWSILSGIQTLPHQNDDVYGMGYAEHTLGAAGGVTSLSTRPDLPADFHRITYSTTNRNYAHRLLYSGAVELHKGWASSFGVNRRWGRDSYVKGLFTDLNSGSFSINKQFGEHAISLLYSTTYGEQGVRSAATQEVYELAGSNYYNPNWGYQNGKVRNNRVRSYGQHFAALSYRGKAAEKVTLQAALSLFGGKNGYSLLSWYDAPTPYPDYYRSLPDFFGNPAISEPLRQAWQQGDAQVRQIDWGRLYEANRYNYTSYGVSRSHYVIREQVTDKRNIALSASLVYEIAPRLRLRGGFALRRDFSENYGRLKDLLGGDYWLDIDQFLLDDEYDGEKLQNDVRHPNRRVKRGEKFGYNYTMRGNSARVWGVLDYRSSRWEAYAGGEMGARRMQRQGRYEKEMFPGQASFGRSSNRDFTEYTLKAGVFRNFTLRHRLGIQLMAANVAPLVRNLFIAPAFRNATLPEAGVTRIAGAEAAYQWTLPFLKIDATAYATTFHGEGEVRSYYDDIENEYFNLILTDLNKVHAGIEIGIEWNITPVVTLLTVGSWNIYQYDSDPSVTLLRDKDGETMIAGAKSYLKGFRAPGGPQSAGMARISYRTPGRWYLHLSGQYIGNNYVSLNPIRRMSRAIDLAGSPEARQEMFEQERLDDAVTLGLSVSKNFRLGNGHSIGLWLLADNLLHDKNIRYAGYEQMRFSKTNYQTGRTLKAFPSKYYYAYGATYYCSISYTF